MTLTRPVEPVLFGLVSLAGLGAFVLPLWSGPRASTGLLVSFVIAAAALLLALALQTHRLSARLAAVLAALIAVDAALRLAAVVGVAGFSPIFFLILVCGYVFGPGIGFAMGALTLLLSAVFTAGVGPWLPYQMLGCAWVGAGLRFGRRCLVEGEGVPANMLGDGGAGAPDPVRDHERGPEPAGNDRPRSTAGLAGGAPGAEAADQTPP